jgi:hypothetical protein
MAIMKLVMSLSVDRISREPNVFWPPGLLRLTVIVTQPDDDPERSRDHGRDRRHDTLSAVGIHTDGRYSRLVFEARFPRDRLGAFMKAVTTGDMTGLHCNKGKDEIAVQGTRCEPSSIGVDDCVKVTLYRDPETRELKTALALAAALHSTEALAEAVVSSYPRCPPSKPY